MNWCKYSMKLLIVMQLFFGCYGLTMAPAWGQQEDWHLEKDKDQIQVYSRKVPGNRLTELKVECLMPGTQSQLVALLSDIANYKNVIYKTKSAQLIRRVSETELLYHVVSALPWPVSDREMSVRLTFAQDPASKLMQIRGVGVPNLVVARPGTVRVADWLAVWLVRPVAKQQLGVTYTCRVDPGGEIPAWLDNIAMANSAYQSFTLIGKSLSLPRYQGKSFAFLTK